MPSKNAQPIPNSLIRNQINNHNVSCLEIDLQTYLDKFTLWLQDSKSNTLLGLEQFTSRSFTYGTTQSFDHFYLKHRHRRFRFFKGEFMYHRASMKVGLDYEFIDNAMLDKNDAVILSVPFSDSGKIKDLDRILELCTKLNIPVLIDLAYYPLSFDINVNLNYDCIEVVAASLSKAFDGAQYLRAGIRFKKLNEDDGIDIANSVSMVPNHTLSTAYMLMNNYSINYNLQYKQSYLTACKLLNLNTTNCLMFGVSFTDYQDYNRGNLWNRVCVSEDIGKIYDSSKSQ